MKSVIVEIKNDFAAILSDDGSVTRIRNRNYVVGQVIEMNVSKASITKRLVLGVASVAMLVFTTSIGAWAYTTPYSYVSLDVNPSIEYTLNRFQRVIDVKAVNDDGQVILDEIDIAGLNNHSIEDAILDTVEQISQDGYFSGDTVQSGTDSALAIEGGIIITVSNENAEISDELTNEIRDAVKDYVNENVEVEVSNVDSERVQEAKELGVTPGKLNLVEKLQASAEDPDSIVLEDWIHKPVKVIMKAIKENEKASANKADIDTDENTASSETALVDDETTKDDVDKTEDDDKTEVNDKDSNKDNKKTEKDNKKAEKALDAQAKAAEKTKAEQEKADEKAKDEQERNEEKAKVDQEKAREKAKDNKEKADKKAEAKKEKADEKSNAKIEKADEKSSSPESNSSNQGNNADKEKDNN